MQGAALCLKQRQAIKARLLLHRYRTFLAGPGPPFAPSNAHFASQVLGLAHKTAQIAQGSRRLQDEQTRSVSRSLYSFSCTSCAILLAIRLDKKKRSHNRHEAADLVQEDSTGALLEGTWNPQRYTRPFGANFGIEPSMLDLEDDDRHAHNQHCRS
jgi:hypothetical protein